MTHSPLTPTKTVRPRVAVIGTGRWGRNLVRAFGNAHAASLAWIVDPDPEALAAAESLAGGSRAVTDIEETGYDFDVAVVSTAATDHVRHALPILGRGKHVFVEKPAAMTTEDATALADAARRNNRRLMVGHQLLFHPAFDALAAIWASGTLGPIRKISAERTGDVDMSREPGVIWSYGPHDVAMILALTGASPVTVIASGTVGDRRLPHRADITLDFPEGITAAIRLRANDGSRVRRLTVSGEHGVATFDDSVTGGTLTVDGGRGNAPTFTATEPLAVQCAHFLDAITQESEPTTGPDHIVQVTRILTAANRQVTK
jgi:predicted dehydrogenase